MGNARNLGIEQGNATFLVQHGNNGKGEQDDSHTSNPLGHGTPEQHAMGYLLDIADNARSGSGKTCHRLEEGVSHVIKCVAEQIGQHAKE